MTKFKLDARWAIVAVGFVALSLAFSGRSMLSLAMAEWTTEFGWTKSSISGIMTVTLVFMAGLAPLVGYAIDRSGPRVILTGGLVMVGASSAVLAGMDSMLAFIIGFAVLGAFGFGLVATHAVSSAVARSFDVGQGRAVGIATSGSTAGQFVFMPILGLVLAGGGWRLGYEALAGACLVVAIVAWWMLRNAGAATAARGPAKARTKASSRASVTCCGARPSTACSGASCCAATRQRAWWRRISSRSRSFAASRRRRARLPSAS